MKIDGTTTLTDLQNALKDHKVTFATIRHTSDGGWHVRFGSLAALDSEPSKGDGLSLAEAMNAAVTTTKQN